MQDVILILKNTPWWVYVLFIYLVIMGLKATRTRTVALWKLFILPVLFSWMSIHSLISSFPIDAFSVSTWGGAILIGTFFGWLQMHRSKIDINKQKHQITLPGTWWTLILILLIFATKYYFGYQLGVDPTLKYQSHFEFSMLAVSGIITGLFIGRALALLIRYCKK